MFYLADFILSLVPTDRIPAHLTSYIPGKTPFSTWPGVISMTVTYLMIVFGTREIMKDMPPLQLRTLFRAHNLLLSIGSLILFALLGEEVFSNWLKPEIGRFGSLCASGAYTSRLEFYFMLNYGFKYYEFIDTVFLVLRKKPLSFLHVYHHAATAILAFLGLNDRAPIFWVPAFINLGVHVLMYYYYYATSGGAKLWWKRHLTTLQICQFLVILATGIFAYYHYVVHNWFPGYFPSSKGCYVGNIAAGYVEWLVIFSYLLLFIDFFHETYVQKSGSHDPVGWLGFKSAVQRRFKPSTVAPENLRFRVDKARRVK